MVLGLRSKHRKAGSIQVDYHVLVKEIKPWPPSLTPNSVQPVLLQWENGDQNSGSIASTIGDGKIEFNNSFSLPITLQREKRSNESFQKNCLEFFLYEPRKDKPSKGQLLGSAMINLADYGIIKESLIVSAPLNFKRSSKSVVQPVLVFHVEPFDKDSSTSSPKSNLSKEASLDHDGGESNDDESEIASFTDDDESSHSSWTNSSSNLGTKNGSSHNKESVRSPEQEVVVRNFSEEFSDGSRQIKVNSNPNGENHVLASKWSKNDQADSMNTNFLRVGLVDGKETKKERENGHGEDFEHNLAGNNILLNHSRRNPTTLRSDTLTFSRRAPGVQVGPANNSKLKHVKSVQYPFHSSKDNGLFNYNPPTLENLKGMGKIEDPRSSAATGKPIIEISEPRPGFVESKTDYHNGATGKPTMEISEPRPGFVESKTEWKSKTDYHNGATGKPTIEISEPRPGFVESKTEWKSKIEALEEELRETAVLESALYSVVAEHGSSTNKVHASARRLSRFYLHACKARSPAKTASAVRAIVSGLILVSKSCGNDVPRLSFWLSNSIMLRVIVNQSIGNTSLSSTGKVKKYSAEESDDWEDPQTFTVALEKVEAWIFSRIVESVWWQTLTPRMQSSVAPAFGRRVSATLKKTRSVMVDQEQGNFSVQHWKKAFKDACERICPIRAGGHECGCLSLLSRLVMEQLVSRLDVAMFNAILRESADDMPTDPVSDPISDSNVLPIPAGKTSFVAGAQLKNAIGNWSLWLTDLFGVEDNDSHECTNDADNDSAFKAFRLLNALSDLMMLPSEMLADSSTRKEVCPFFDAPLIKRVLYNFVPDEFCPDPIPESVFVALDAEEAIENDGESFPSSSFPCAAGTTVYSPPPAASLAWLLGEVGTTQSLQRSGSSSVLRKSYTSDDELDELGSPLTSIVIDKCRVSPGSKNPKPNWRMPSGKGGRDVVRYRLLREVWRDGE